MSDGAYKHDPKRRRTCQKWFRKQVDRFTGPLKGLIAEMGNPSQLCNLVTLSLFTRGGGGGAAAAGAVKLWGGGLKWMQTQKVLGFFWTLLIVSTWFLCHFWHVRLLFGAAFLSQFDRL